MKSNVFGLSKMDQVRVAIIGEQCSGKTTLMNAIRSKMVEFGQVEIIKFAGPIYGVLDVLKKKKHRKFMQDFSTVAQDCFGTHVFSELFEKRMIELQKSETNYSAILCDDVRRDYELEMTKAYKFVTVFVETPESVRMERAKKQGLEFIKDHSSEIYVDGMKGLCDIVVDGDVPKNKLNDYVEAILIFANMNK